MPKKYDEDETNSVLDQLDSLNQRLKTEAVVWTKQLNARIKLLRWLASYKEQVKRGYGLANLELNTHQSSLFAFSVENNNPSNFILCAQAKEFSWLKDIAIVAASILEDGLLIRCASINIVGVSISSLTIKIPFSSIYKDKLIAAFKQADWLWLCEIESLDSSHNLVEWEIIQVNPKPIRLSKVESDSHLKTKLQSKFL